MGDAEPLGELGVVEVGEVFDGEGGAAADLFEGEGGGDAEDAEVGVFGGAAAAGGVFDDEGEFFFEFGVVFEIQFVEGEVVAFGVGLAHADVFDGDEDVEVVAEFEGVEEGEDFLLRRAFAPEQMARGTLCCSRKASKFSRTPGRGSAKSPSFCSGKISCRCSRRRVC